MPSLLWFKMTELHRPKGVISIQHREASCNLKTNVMFASVNTRGTCSSKFISYWGVFILQCSFCHHLTQYSQSQFILGIAGKNNSIFLIQADLCFQQDKQHGEFAQLCYILENHRVYQILLLQSCQQQMFKSIISYLLQLLAISLGPPATQDIQC